MCGGPHFDVPELRILMDAVQASSFITPSKTEVLLDKIADLGGSHRAELLRSNIVIYVIKICEILDCNVSDVMTVDKR